MKKIISVLLTCAMMSAFTACGGDSVSKSGSEQQDTSKSGSTGGNSLVVYFSATGNTEAVAETLTEIQGAEIFEIAPEDPYTEEDLDYNNDSSRANAEQNDENSRPAISGTIDNIDDYDVIYVGFPIWWGNMPRIMYTFFDTYDFSGKTIAPFCTSGGSGISEAVSSIEELEPDAGITEGLRTSTSEAADDITQWLERTGLAQ